MLRRIFFGFAPTTVVLLLFIAPLNVNAHNQRSTRWEAQNYRDRD